MLLFSNTLLQSRTIKKTSLVHFPHLEYLIDSQIVYISIELSLKLWWVCVFNRSPEIFKMKL